MNTLILLVALSMGRPKEPQYTGFYLDLGRAEVYFDSQVSDDNHREIFLRFGPK